MKLLQSDIVDLASSYNDASYHWLTRVRIDINILKYLLDNVIEPVWDWESPDVETNIE